MYTIAGVAVVVTSAGAVYYLSDSRRSGHEAAELGEKKKSKKERRREKRKAEEEKRSENAAPVADSGRLWPWPVPEAWRKEGKLIAAEQGRRIGVRKSHRKSYQR